MVQPWGLPAGCLAPAQALHVSPSLPAPPLVHCSPPPSVFVVFVAVWQRSGKLRQVDYNKRPTGTSHPVLLSSDA